MSGYPRARRRLRRWTVYRFDALPAPDDFVHEEARCWTRRGAERLRRRLGPNLALWQQLGWKPPCYYGILRAPRLLPWRARRRLRREATLAAAGRCPDCWAQLPEPLAREPERWRCREQPRRGMVYGHGPQPTKPPPRRSS